MDRIQGRMGLGESGEGLGRPLGLPAGAYFIAAVWAGVSMAPLGVVRVRASWRGWAAVTAGSSLAVEIARMRTLGLEGRVIDLAPAGASRA
jgi:hypothetical protein